AMHTAGPCPREAKKAMLEWWGPILHETYGGSETNGATYASPQDWLAHPGTVGRAVLGVVHICDDDGNDVPVGDVGLVYFELPEQPFEYHKDPDRTRAVQNRMH